MSNLILIGMPACGKSVAGVVLAKTMQKNFIDTDLLIQEKEDRLLQEIIDADGNDYFRKTEEEVLMHLDVENTVIATGGSAVYYPDAIRHLKERGQALYLKVSLETILGRLDNITTRGVTADVLNSPRKFLKTAGPDVIAEIYRQRAPLYEQQADRIIEAEGLTVEETVTKIMEVV